MSTPSCIIANEMEAEMERQISFLFCVSEQFFCSLFCAVDACFSASQDCRRLQSVIRSLAHGPRLPLKSGRFVAMKISVKVQNA